MKASSVTGNKTLWKSVKPLFSKRVMTSESITLVDNNLINSNDEKVSEILNIFFSNAVKNLDIEMNMDVVNLNVNEIDPVKIAIKKFEHHPSIIKIREKFGSQDVFSFTSTSYERVYKEIMSLDVSKACPKSSIPPKMLKDYCHLFSLKLNIDFNFCMENGSFPENLKLADISPIHKKETVQINELSTS